MIMTQRSERVASKVVLMARTVDHGYGDENQDRGQCRNRDETGERGCQQDRGQDQEAR